MKKLIKPLILLAFPLILQRLINTVFSSVDVWMVGQLGQDTISGISVGGQLLWVLNRVLTGISAGGLIFITQYNGSGKSSASYRIFRKMLLVMTVCAGAVAVIGIIIPDVIVRLFEGNENVMEIAAQYLRISALSFILLAATNACTTFLIAQGRSSASMIAGFSNAIVHIILNWLLVFKLKLDPGAGAAGAAIGAAAAGFLTALPFVMKEIHHIRREEVIDIHFKKYYKLSLSLILHEGTWGIGIVIYNMIFSHLNPDGYSAVVIWRTAHDFFFAIVCGFVTAGGIYLGNFVGENNFDKSIAWTKMMQIINNTVAAIVGVVLFLGAKPFVQLFNLASGMDSGVVNTAVLLVRIYSCGLVLRTIPHTFIEGVFRPAGNPEMGLILDTVATWVVVIPLCLLAAWVLDLGFVVVFTIMCYGEDFVKMMIGYWYFKTGRWYRPVVK